MKLVLIEDDPSIAEPLVAGLQRHGFEVRHTVSGRVGLELAEDADMVLLDLGLTDLDGTEVCREIRARANTPIIVISARGDELDRVMLLELGADDYLVKPFGLRELIARVRAVSRRITGDRPSEGSDLGALHIDRRTHEVRVGDQALALTPKEFDLLAFLAEDPGAVRTRAEITLGIWGSPYISAKTLDVAVSGLRKKLGDPRWIAAIRGVGFRLVDPAA